MLRTYRYLAATLFLACLLFVPGGRYDVGRPATVAAQAVPKCSDPEANEIVKENCETGSPASAWDVVGAGDASIQGFATDISVNRGQTVRFKIKTPSTNYRLDIYRMGYYGGAGARLIATVQPTPEQLGQTQPTCLADASTGLVDCGNWFESASWQVPAQATSGIYFAKAIREDLEPSAPEAASHIVFIVRDDAGQSALLFQTSDTTWQAYNDYGGNSLYTGTSLLAPGRAVKISYNRPFVTRAVDGGRDWLFNAEYPMVRFLEANGYDVSYITGVDTDRGLGGQNPVPGHRIFLSVGHDEYWSAVQRANVEAARDAGINLAFFSGNEVFWKIRWEASAAGGVSHRTLVCYKETDGTVDPSNTWTGTWRDARTSPPEDGGRPENALTGTLFAVNDDPDEGGTGSITVPEPLGNLRFWRNTSVANLTAGEATLPFGTRGYEWDEDANNGVRPSGLIQLSSTTVNVGAKLQNAGTQYGPGTATHNLTLYRAPSPGASVPGALVFGAGTIQWSWGLDAVHDRAGTPVDVSMQQATVNLFADMGVVQAAGVLMPGLISATPSTDAQAPASTFVRPLPATRIPVGRPYVISGTSADTDGAVARVEVSTDGGASWHGAAGLGTWTYVWKPAAIGPVQLKVRAIDDNGNIESPVEQPVEVIAVDPNAGPGGPILVVTSPQNPFTRYYAEILRAEGLNAFGVADIASITTLEHLQSYDVVMLGEMPLTAAQVTIFTQWVEGGGNLIAMRPDKALYGLLGLSEITPATTLANGYVLFDRAQKPAAGLVGETIQFHGTADLAAIRALDGATPLAELYSDATTRTTRPAVTVHNVGAAGGHAAAFMFDLARSVVYTRQGNPDWSGLDRDGNAPIRSNDLFFDPGGAHWVDLNKVHIPQADEQQRLLANLILHVNVPKKPLPRFWYFPRGEKGVIVMTGDDHGMGGTAGRFQSYKEFSPPNCSVDDWECVRASSYIYPNSGLLDADAAGFSAAGFEIFVHVNTQCGNWTPASLNSFYTNQIALFHEAYPSLPPGVSHRVHCIAWSDYATQPQVELSHGIRMDTNYYYWPPEWVANRPGMFTGSGLTMRFAKPDGTMIDVYQAASQMTDESNQVFPDTVNALLDKALGPEGYYGAFTANMHTDSNLGPPQEPRNSKANSDFIVNAAKTRGVPVISARQLLTWVDGRNESSFDAMSWSPANNTLAFTIVPGDGANGLEAMLPVRSGALKLATVTRGATNLLYRVETIKGIAYAFFPAVAGAHVATYAIDNSAPLISNLTAIATGPTTALVTWTTDEPATSRIEYGTAAEELTDARLDDSLVTSHSITLTGLAAATTYYFRVSSQDASDPANSAMTPDPPAAPASFTTPQVPPPTFIDTTFADFRLGSVGSSTYVAETANGEVILKPTVGTELFAKPADWFITSWDPLFLGAATFKDGKMFVDGALVGQDVLYEPGRSLEFVATFTDVNQHVGFGIDFNNPPWAIFSSDGSRIYASTNTICPNIGPGCTALDPALYGLGVAHRYRIEWTADAVRYYVDGNLVATHIVSMTAPMRPLAASDLGVNEKALISDWFRMSPYAGSGSFLSRVFDANNELDSNNWGRVWWTAVQPAGTTLTLSVRTGNSPNPDDGTWTPFRVVPASGAVVGGTGDHLQYRATFVTAVPGVTPELQEVVVEYGVEGQPADDTPPIIQDVAAVSTELSTVITWTTDEPATSRVDYWSGSLEPLTAGGAELVTQHRVVLTGLFAGTTYTYNVTSTNFSNKSATSPSATFDTPSQTFTDTLVSDFSQGQRTNTSITNVGNGEVTLALALDETFSGTSVPQGWDTGVWNSGGTVSVGNDRVTVDGARVSATTAFTAGVSIEFEATFGTAPSQHVGLVQSTAFDSTWAMFSTAGSTNQLYARTNGGGQTDTLIGTSLNGMPLVGERRHYRIDWNAESVVYLIDGTEVARHALPAAGLGTMKPIASDFSTGGAGLSVEYVRANTFNPSGTFVSRVFDAGQPASWDKVVWTSVVPEGTTLSMSVSTGNSVTPDATWETTPLSASGLVERTSRFIQYRATLGTSVPTVTPVLSEVTVTVRGLPQNEQPTAAGISLSVTEDQPKLFTLTGSDPEGSALTVSVASNPAHGTLSGVAPNLIYTPGADYFGPDSFTFTVNDGELTSEPATVSIVVNGVNDNPVAIDDAVTVAEDSGATVINVLGNDHDGVDTLETLTVTAVTQATNGTVTFTATGASYTPTLNFHGSDSFSYTLSDGNGGTATGTVTVTVTPINDNPTAVDDAVTVAEDSGATVVNVLANDHAGVDTGETLTVTAVTQGTNGTVTFTATGASYTPTLNFHGTDSFSYTLSDGNGGTATGTVTVTVTPINDNPIAVDDAVTVAEDSGATIVNVLGNDSDGVDTGETLAVTAITQGTNGTVTLVGGVVSYTPNGDFHGTDSFSYTLSDGNGGTATATVAVTITPVNDNPVATDDVLTVAEDSGATVVTVLTNDTHGVDTAETLAVTAITQGANGTVTLVGGLVSYTPNSDFHGTDSFTYTLSDGNGGTATATVAVTVTAVNDAPVALDGALTVSEDTPASGTLTATDVDNGTLTYSLASNGTNGAVVITNATTGAYSYTPNADVHGTDSFTFTVSDGTATSAAATVSITVTSANDLPTISDTTDQTTTDGTALIGLPIAISDVETPAGSLQLSAQSSNPALVPASNVAFNGTGGSRTMSVTPVSGQTGTATITVTVTDGDAGTRADSFVLTVNPGSQPTTTALTSPTASPTTYGTAIVLNATVTVTGGGTPTGAVEFFDGATSLGIVPLSGDTASMAPTTITAGTPTVTAVYRPTGSFLTSTGTLAPRTINKATAASSQTVSPLTQQYTDNETFQVTVTGAYGAAPAAGVNFKIGTQTMNTNGPVPFVYQGSGVWKATLTQQLLETVSGQLNPNGTAKIVAATLSGVSPNYTVSNPSSKSMTINKEEATVSYDGPMNVVTSPAGSSTATIQLRAIVTDIADGTRGSVGKATVTFYNRDTNTPIATVAVTPDAADPTTGVATYNWSVNIGTVTSKTYKVGFVVGSYFMRNNTADDRVITVTK